MIEVTNHLMRRLIDLQSLSVDRSTGCTIYTKPVEPVLVSKCMTILSSPTNTEDNRPVHLYFNRHLPDVYHIKDTADKHRELSHRIVYCNSWSELSEQMKSKPNSICFHVSELQYTSAVEIVNMVQTLSKLLEQLQPITMTAGIEKNTELSVIKELQKNSIFGIVPSIVSFGMEETSKALDAQWNNIPYWPKHILDQLPGAKTKKKTVNLSEIKLTPRQQQILHLIQERGSSNKVIAKTLGISESTVKLHVGLVLKKFGVRNRTQLAVYSKK